MEAKGASLRELEPEVATAGAMGHMVITVLGMVADMELKFIRDRQRAGIEAAKQKVFIKATKKPLMTLRSDAWLKQAPQRHRSPATLESRA